MNRSNARGMTLVEGILFGSLSLVVLLGVAQLLTKPAFLHRMADVADDQSDAQRAEIDVGKARRCLPSTWLFV